MGIIKSQDIYWMSKAYEMAKEAKHLGEVPVGAVLVSEEDRLLAAKGNAVIRSRDPSAHAELLVLREGALKIGNYRLENTTLYCTLEPCVMCAGAMVHARIQRVVFACRDLQAGAAGSVCNLLKGQPWNHRVEIDEGIMEEDCKKLLRDFFKDLRLYNFTKDHT